MSSGTPGLADVDAALAQGAPLPRSNGELVFEEPWQGRALGMAVVALERAGIPWTAFSRRLAEAVGRRGYNPDESAAAAYYAAWLDALESTVDEAGILRGAGLGREPSAPPSSPGGER
ncbi:MAG: nitrile hydratase accessory protein [Actinobacteria bacterium]|nr:MAG: nitrile hydratase accessory protein [Actinomycetota bacterium]